MLEYNFTLLHNINNKNYNNNYNVLMTILNKLLYNKNIIQQKYHVYINNDEI